MSGVVQSLRQARDLWRTDNWVESVLALVIVAVVAWPFVDAVRRARRV